MTECDGFIIPHTTGDGSQMSPVADNGNFHAETDVLIGAAAVSFPALAQTTDPMTDPASPPTTAEPAPVPDSTMPAAEPAPDAWAPPAAT